MNTTSVTLGTLVERTLLELQSPGEQGLQVTLAVALGATDPTLTLALGAGSVNASDMLQFGDELMLVTAKSADVVPIFTVSREYYSSVAETHVVGTVGTVNPPFPIVRVTEAIRRSLARLEALGLPLVSGTTYTRVTDQQYVLLPENVREVLRVGYVTTETGEWFDLPQWQFIEDVPTAKFSTGKILRTPRFVSNTDELEVVVRTSYRWSTWPAPPTSVATVSLPEGAEDLPCAYAAAWLVGAREISRVQLDRAEEWNVGEPVRNGVSLSLLRAKWQDFYRLMDEARRLYVAPVHRPYRRMPKI